MKNTQNNCLIYMYAEIGRFPLYIICIYKRIIKYWLKHTITLDHRLYTIIHVYSIYNRSSSSPLVIMCIQPMVGDPGPNCITGLDIVH